MLGVVKFDGGKELIIGLCNTNQLKNNTPYRASFPPPPSQKPVKPVSPLGQVCQCHTGNPQGVCVCFVMAELQEGKIYLCISAFVLAFANYLCEHANPLQ